MKKLSIILATTAVLAVTALPASAATINWNFGEHGFGALPNVQQFDTGGFFLGEGV